MVNILLAILFSFSANLDNIPIAISYGLKKIHIPYSKILIISIFTTLFTFISMSLGSYLTTILSEKIANSVGSYILIILGIYTIIKEIIDKRKINRCCKFEDIEPITFFDTMTIVLILSTNNIAAGIAASAAGLNILITTIFSFIFSFSFLLIGNIIGKNIINKFIEKYCNLISSLILILIGIVQL